MSHAMPQSELLVAGRRLDRAQAELAKALEELPVSARADKTIVTGRLRLALGEIVAAKKALDALLAKKDL